MERAQGEVGERFNTKDMGRLEVDPRHADHEEPAARTITLDQELYVTKALEKYGLAQCKVADTPEVVGQRTRSPAISSSGLLIGSATWRSLAR